MANHKKEESEKRTPRCVTLSDNEIDAIKRLAGKNGLSESIRELFNIAEKLESKNE